MMFAKFTKATKLNLISHLVIFLTIFSLLSFHIGGLWLDRWRLPAWYAIPIYALFLLILAIGIVGNVLCQDAMARLERKYATRVAKMEAHPKILSACKKAALLKGYTIRHLRYILYLARSSRVWKTTPMQRIIRHIPNQVRAIFSFKERKNYLGRGIPVLRVFQHEWDSFTGKEAFAQSLCIAYPIGAQGATRISIPIYTASAAGLREYEERYPQQYMAMGTAAEKDRGGIPDYRGEVMEMLTHEACWCAKMARGIARDYGGDETRAKFAVSKAVMALQSEGTIARLSLKMRGRDIMLYYKRDPTLSGLHRFMERHETRKLDSRGIAYELAQPGESVPDVMTKDFDMELETGLKHDLGEFAERMSNVRKRTYVIVPNQVEKERYQKIIGNPLVTVLLLDEF